MEYMTKYKHPEGFLPAAEVSTLNELAADLRETTETVQRFRTRTEMLAVVLNDLKRPTPDAKYWQVIREQNAMYQELKNESLHYRQLSLDIKRLGAQLLSETDELIREYIVLEIDKIALQIENLKMQARARVREIMDWSEIKKQLKPHLKYGATDPGAHQVESMKLSLEMQQEMITGYTSITEAKNLRGPLISIDRMISEQELQPPCCH